MRPYQHMDLITLLYLYQPIVGTTGTALYLTLYHQLPLYRPGRSQFFQHFFLLGLCSISLKEMVEARHVLEGVGLLNCYERKDLNQGDYYEYEIIPPLTPAQFFESDVLSLFLFNELGKEKYAKIRKQFIVTEDDADAAATRNITKSFQEVFASFSPHEVATSHLVESEVGAMEASATCLYVNGKFPEHQTDHDFSLVRMRLSSVVDEDVWTEDLISQLREICFLYQLTEWDLLKALQNPYITHHGMIDLDRLRSFVKNEYRLQYGNPPVVVSRKDVKKSEEAESASNPLTDEEKHIQQLARISPLELLTHYQGGAQIPKSDMELVDALVQQYQLPYGIINVLLEYVLLKYDYRLPRNLVEKIAGHWKRLGIQTAEAAVEQARKEDWELNKNKTAGAQKKKNVKKEIKSLPKAVQKQMQTKQTENIAKDDLDVAKRKARIQAKLQMMHEKPDLRNNEKENLS
jgi:replication initiation and membrane attachment protein